MGRLISLLLVLLGFIFTVLVLIPIAPWQGSELGTDPGVFLYIGRKILSGSIPYRDLWDHKPPLIYYINAFGLLLSGQSRWGVWFIEVASLFAAIVLSFKSFAKSLGSVPAFFGTGSWLISLPLILKEGNYTEEFALPFQFAALYLFQIARFEIEPRKSRWLWLGLGISTAFAFLARPNLVGTGTAIVLTLLCLGLSHHNLQETIRKLGIIASGFALITIPVALYFLANNALDDLWDAVFLYNFSYVQDRISSDQLAAISAGITALGNTGIFYVALMGWFCGVVYLVQIRRKAVAPNTSMTLLLILALIGLPLELILSSISIRPFNHYYIAWLPILGFLSAVAVYFVSNFLISLTARNLPRLAPIVRSFPVALLTLLSISIAIEIWPSASLVITSPPFEYPVVTYMRSNTTPGQSVLIWGAAVRYNFDANRDAPGKYIYQWPLFVSGYTSDSDAARLLQDLELSHPQLIVDTTSTFTLMPSLDPAQRAAWLLHPPLGYTIVPGMDKVFTFIQSNYTNIGVIPQTQWTAYTYTGP